MSRTTCFKRILIFAIELIVLILFMPVCRVAAADNAPADITLDVSQGDIVILENEITHGGSPSPVPYAKDQQITITGSTTDYTITVADGVTANITLDNVNIDVSSKSGTAAFKIADNSTGNVTITLKGDNTLTSGENCAGLQKNVDNISTAVGKLTIQGSGSLTATGGKRGAGIGGGGNNTSNITISGGEINATGSTRGAGIGGGGRENAKEIGFSGSNITIDGGKVEAKGGVWGAGIGGGGNGNGLNITIINNSNVTATGRSHGAGIGGGNRGSGSNITINNSVVTATGGSNGAGIGGGGDGNGAISGYIVDAGSSEVINISNSTVTATSEGNGAGIGGGGSGNGSGDAGSSLEINISNSTVTATSKKCGAGIGGGGSGTNSGKGGKGEDITISNSTVTAKNEDNGAGIGGGQNAESSSDIKIQGGSVKATGGKSKISCDPTDITGESSDEHKVHLFEIPTGGKPVTITTANGEPYNAPATHGDEDKIYVYLPAGGKSQNKYNLVNIGGEIVKCYYEPDSDTNNNDWYSSPIITPYGGTFSNSQEVEIFCTEGSTIYYTTDGSNPEDSSTKQTYNGAFEITETTTITAIAYKKDVPSEVVTAVFEKQSDSGSSKPIQPIKPIEPTEPIKPTEPAGHDYSNISIDVQLGENAPKTEIKTTLEDLAQNALTFSDRLKAEGGLKVKIILTVDDVTQTVSDEDKSKIEAEINKLSYNMPGAYLNVSLMKVVGEVQKIITETKAPITITLEIPEAIRSKNRVYAAIRIHDGETTILPDLDENENTVTVQTDKFSTYAIIYKDIKPEGDASGESSDDSTGGSPVTSGDSSDGSASVDASDNSPESSTSSSDNPGDSKGNPYTGGIDAAAISVFTALGALAAVLACALKGKK